MTLLLQTFFLYIILQTQLVYDWKVIENKFDSSSITQYIEIWEDYDVMKSYTMYNTNKSIKKEGLNDKGNKSSSMRSKFNRISNVVKGIKMLGGWVEIEKKPDTMEDYGAWKNKLSQNSYLASTNMFRELVAKNVLPQKFKRVEDLNITALGKALSAYEKVLR